MPSGSPHNTLFDPALAPSHLAVIMDGNGRWAKSRGLSRMAGHEKGAETLRTIARACGRLGVRALTVYAFSEENWNRPKAEVAALMKLLARFLKREKSELHEGGIRLNAIGSLHKLPANVRGLLEQAMAETAENSKMVLTFALSYGGQQEILDAARQCCRDAMAGRLSPEDLDAEGFAQRLYTRGLPPVDLMIRTSGEKRLSNFLLWQNAYAEFVFTDTYWPDFDETELTEILREYAGRERRFGKTGDQLKRK